jgi:hypothetical protein
MKTKTITFVLLGWFFMLTHQVMTNAAPPQDLVVETQVRGFTSAKACALARDGFGAGLSNIPDTGIPAAVVVNRSGYETSCCFSESTGEESCALPKD